MLCCLAKKKTPNRKGALAEIAKLDLRKEVVSLDDSSHSISIIIVGLSSFFKLLSCPAEEKVQPQSLPTFLLLPPNGGLIS